VNVWLVVTPQYDWLGPDPNTATAVTCEPLCETDKLFNGQHKVPPTELTGLIENEFPPHVTAPTERTWYVALNVQLKELFKLFDEPAYNWLLDKVAKSE